MLLRRYNTNCRRLKTCFEARLALALGDQRSMMMSLNDRALERVEAILARAEELRAGVHTV